MDKDIMPENVLYDLRYLQLLARSFPTIADASTEIINLEAILNLPKGTEHFLTDIHGEHQAFNHVLKNASGAVKRKVNEIFSNTLRDQEKKELCSLIYYPEEKLELIKSKEPDLDDWYLITLNQLVKVCRNVSSKYTRSKVRKALPKEFSYIIQELLHESSTEPNKSAYIDKIISTIISTGRADDFIVAMCNLIQRLTIDLLHIVGDIYDRGPGAHIIMDTLCDYHNFDIQWGNHDILWMGAAAGNLGSIANVIRMCLRYGNLATLEDGYGINLLPLATFAMEMYGDDPCDLFIPRTKFSDNVFDEKTIRLISQMHKAITIIQFKLEGEIIRRRPEFDMDDRMLLHHINLSKGTIRLNGNDYELRDKNLPTIDPKDPYRLSIDEEDLIRKIHHSFQSSDKLKKHMRCLFRHGSMYQVCNSNLLYHASVPLNADGTLKDVCIEGKIYKGKALLDKVDQLVRTAYFDSEDTPDKQFAMDYIWYLWCGKDSPLFDKSCMTTFERCFLEEKETQKEEKGAYYVLRKEEKICDMLLDEFGVTGQHRHIINGHVPVRSIQGENPIKANGKMLVIDGGFSKAYHPETGIAGYTLVYHSRGFQLVQHEPFESTAKAIEEGLDIKSTTIVVELSSHRQMVRDTDKGAELQKQIEDLEKLLYAYRNGFIKEKERNDREQ
ncbi:fructose-1,6-bisphosphatase [Parabacteroides bouchesdurhonensis]|uniref:fructose-1,6-bisphosphatase n=1 Tax=Parabacteroides bouchesdurhonensis TaxID=1936995 RepID=UPI000C8612E7|nr:fructose-1,6-bisphosphatase [Parabacteroides bouchesdurhonensis]RHJ90219.1 fructose-1,6-bisphosphatase [Bacteroides sp. AM07-16]